MRKICYKGRFYEGGSCLRCGKNRVSIYRSYEGYVAVCTKCKDWEWLEDAVNSSMLKLVK